MGEWLGKILEHIDLNEHELLILAVMVIVLSQTGFPQMLIRRYTETRKNERARLSEDQQAYMDRIEDQLDDERRRHTEDIAHYESLLTALRTELRGRDETIALQAVSIVTHATSLESCEKGAQRWRHMARNIAHLAAYDRDKMRRAGINVEPFKGFGDILDVPNDDVADIMRYLNDPDEDLVPHRGE